MITRVPIEIDTPDSLAAGNRTLIPLGPKPPFIESELTPTPGSDGAYAVGAEIHFAWSEHFALVTPNLSGGIRLDSDMPRVPVLLRLPKDQPGTRLFSFSQLHTVGPGGHPSTDG